MQTRRQVTDQLPTEQPDEDPYAFEINYPTTTQDNFETQLRREDLKNPVRFMAKEVSADMQRRNPHLFSEGVSAYEQLTRGTAPFIREIERGVAISDKELLEKYLRNPNNEPMREGSFGRGFAKELAPGFGGMAGMIYGAKAGFAAQQIIPPTTPWTMGAKVLTPVIGGLTGMIVGEQGIRAAQEAIFGPEDLIVPGTEGMERVGETVGIGASFALTPFAAPTKYVAGKTLESVGESITAAKYLENLAAARVARYEKALASGPLPREAHQAAVKQVAKKDPLHGRLSAGWERMINRVGTEATASTKNKILTGIAEGSFVLGAGGGRYASEEYFEGEGAVPSEIAGGIAVGMLGPALIGGTFYALTNFGAVKDGFMNFYRSFRDKGLKKTLMPGVDEKSLAEVTNIIESKLLEAGEDPEKIVQVLTEALNNPEMKKATSAVLAESPTLLRLEQNLSGLFPDLAEKGREGLMSSLEVYQNAIAMMAQSGDSAALLEIERSFQELLKSELSRNLEEKAAGVLRAAEKVGVQDAPDSIGKALREVTERALATARARERALFSVIPETEISVFRGFPEAGEELGEVRELPNIFDFVDDLPESRAALQDLPKPLQTQINFLKEVLQDAGIDTSQLGKRGGGARSQAPDLTPIENRIGRIDQRIQKLTDEMPTGLRNWMRNTLDDSPFNNSDTLELQAQFIRMEQSTVDGMIEIAVQQGRRQATDELPSISELRQVRKLLDARLSRVRAAEDLARAQDPATALARTDGEVLADEIIDLRALIGELRATGEPVVLSSRKLSEIRSRALQATRELRGADKYNEARLSDRFAKLADQDLTGALDELGNDGAKAALTQARAFSRALNDVFSRSVAGNILDERRSGANALSPEELVRTLFSGPTDKVLKNVREVKNVGLFLRDNPLILAEDAAEAGVPDLGALVNDIDDVIDKSLRTLRSTALKPRNLEDADELSLNYRAVQDFLADPNNKVLLDEVLPEGAVLRQDLEDAEAAYQLLQTARNQAAQRAKENKARLLFKNIVGRGDSTPRETVAEALNSSKPIVQLNDILQTIARASVEQPRRNEARELLTSNILGWAMEKGRKSNGYISPEKMYDALFTPLKSSAGDLSPMDFITTHKLMPEEQIKNLNNLLEEMRRIENLVYKGGMEDLLDEKSPLKELTIRLIGAKLGTTVGQMVPGAGDTSLIAASAGSRALRALFLSKSGINNMRAFKVIMSEPELLVEMLKKPRNQREGVALATRIGRYLTQRGFVLGRRSTVATMGEPEEYEEPTQRPAPEGRRRGPPGVGGQTPPGSGGQMSRGQDALMAPEPRLPAPEPRPTEPQAAIRGTDNVMSVVNNNPGNLRMAGQAGATEGKGGFAAFETPQAGLQALRRQVALDTQERGMNLSQFLSKYAPPSENDTQKYIDFVSRKTGLDPEQRIPPDKITDIMRAIVQMEGGPLALQYFYPERFRAQSSEQPSVELPPMPQIPQPQPQPTPNPQAREQYAALFPNDSTTQLLKSGIGGLA